MADETKTGGFYFSSSYFANPNVNVLQHNVGAISGANSLIEQFQTNFTIPNFNVYSASQVKNK